MARTKTGGFEIGFRQMRGWQDDSGAVIEFARGNGFGVVDYRGGELGDVKRILESGLRVGTVDLREWGDLGSPDEGKRKAAAELNVEWVKAVAGLGVRLFFTVVAPPMEESARDRKENFAFLMDGYGKLCRAIEGMGARIVMEGYPGGWPHHACMGCTPADCRAILKQLGPVMGINFDPSHLIRMEIDPVRFLGEFGPRVYHVHGKDAQILAEGLYEHGNLQRATFESPRKWGGHHWRYCVPGRGETPWERVLGMLRDGGYEGVVSVELEDEEFNGSEEGEKRGLVIGKEFLEQA